jgi:hypothetical protein
MRKIWLGYSDPWWKKVTTLDVFTWNVSFDILHKNIVLDFFFLAIKQMKRRFCMGKIRTQKM